jgi:hypothetical protein
VGNIEMGGVAKFVQQLQNLMDYVTWAHVDTTLSLFLFGSFAQFSVRP